MLLDPELVKRWMSLSVALSPVPGGCKMDIQHELDAQWAEHRERMERGWNMRLEVIKTIAELAI